MDRGCGQRVNRAREREKGGLYTLHDRGAEAGHMLAM